MTLSDIRIILRQLDALAEGWVDDIPAIERDLALEKLRSLYDALRSAEPAAPLFEQTETFSINLDDVLSVTVDEPEFPVREEPVEPVQVSPQPITTEVESPVVAELEAAQEEEDVVAEKPFDTESYEEADPVSVEPITTEIESPVVAELEAAQEKEDVVADKPFDTESYEEAASVSVEPQPKSAPQPEVIAPTLFGMDDSGELFRHQHKKRVMSLYDLEEPDSSPAMVQAAEPKEEVRSVMQEVYPEEDMTVVEELVIEEINLEEESDSESDVVVYPEPEDPSDAVEVSEPEYKAEPEIPAQMPRKGAAGAVLGDVINHEVQTLGEALAVGRASSNSVGQSLRSVIGLNDRFLMIRDLFEGDAEAFELAISEIDRFDDLDDCMIHIAENYIWNPNSDGAKLLMELIERKLA